MICVPTCQNVCNGDGRSMVVFSAAQEDESVASNQSHPETADVQQAFVAGHARESLRGSAAPPLPLPMR